MKKFWKDLNLIKDDKPNLCNSQLINQTSGNFEYYTPIKIVDAARQTMNGIDLDPASSHIANKHVKAKLIFTIEDDGLKQNWFGNVWMNHPFGKAEEACKSKCKKRCCIPEEKTVLSRADNLRYKHVAGQPAGKPLPNNWRGHCITERIPGNENWINKFILEYEYGLVIEACCITYACTSEKWFQPLLPYLQCFLHPRTNYFLPDGSEKQGVTKGSVVTYLGNNSTKFYDNFSLFGHIK